MENNFIYYDRQTGKVLSSEEVKAEWEKAKQEKRSTNMAMALTSNTIIENGYVIEKNIVTVADLMAKSKDQAEETKKTDSIDSLLPPPEAVAPTPAKAPAPSPLLHIKKVDFQSQDVVDNIIARAKAEEEAKEKARTAIIDEIIEGVKVEEQKKDAVLEEIIQSVIDEDKALQAQKAAQAADQQYSITDIIEEAKHYPTIDSTQYNIDQIIQEYGSKPRFVDVTQTVLGPELDTPTEPIKAPEAEKKVTGEPVEDIQDPEYSIRIVNEAQRKKQQEETVYSALVQTSVIEGEIVDFERTGERTGIKYDWLAKGLIALATASILFTGAKMVVKAVDTISNNFKLDSAIATISEHYNGITSLVNRNKITLDGTFDANGWPAYWIDTKGVAQDVLSMPDEAYISTLYLAYDQMGQDRENGPYHNLDDTISHISTLVDETHPTAFLTTAGCSTFDQFLNQAGYFDPETHVPSAAVFEEAAKAELIKNANIIQNNNLNMGGR